MSEQQHITVVGQTAHSYRTPPGGRVMQLLKQQWMVCAGYTPAIHTLKPAGLPKLPYLWQVSPCLCSQPMYTREAGALMHGKP
jgi:hypothetical protein